MTKKRSRTRQAGLTFAAMAAGLGVRKMAGMLPDIVNSYAGDALWALMIFFGFGFLFNKAGTRAVALGALLFCFLIEFSQLYHAPWIDRLRTIPLGGLILGYGFLWSDLFAYLLGVGAGSVLELFSRKRQP
ncbi:MULTISPECIES: ribosomal maturation YjgA family protein [Bacillus]|uniref:ribosomal maturation YjgA family protein n=1 Tax=Bacillus TaxID=1386 RepID=UPI00047A4DE9|nr:MULTISPECIES: DUF2809 domain-containing protein [Bacillus]QHZ48780.1 DUF2809 domain-containing protein [Bacillus sp. NSP9.1]WFA05579.1 DUF2809 domain-containing protein [Bacillus sp. HSf4]